MKHLFKTIVALVAALGLVLGTAVATAADPPSTEVRVEAGPRPDRIVLNPTATPHTSQAVTWRTDRSTTRAVVEYAPQDHDVTRRIAAQGSTQGLSRGSGRHHTATLTGLVPGTTYRYRVGHESGGWSDWYEFTTPREGLVPWRFLYFGDAQNSLDDVWPQVAQQAYAHYPDAELSLHAGDMINNADSEEEWAQWFAAQGSDVRTRNVITTPGNHEYTGDPLLREYRAHFGYPGNGPLTRDEDVWSTDYQGVRFVSLNANVLVGLDQIAWLDRTLAQNPNKWTVVTFHQPLYSGSEGRDNPGIRAAWQPILERHDVDLVLQGHDHVYARGHVTAREHEDGSHSGPVYVVSVAGGKYYDLAPADDNVWTGNGATRAVAAQQISTYQSIEVDRDRLIYRSHVGRLADQPQPAGLEVGDTLDAFTITKGDDGPKRVDEGVETTITAEPVQGVAGQPVAIQPRVEAVDGVAVEGTVTAYAGEAPLGSAPVGAPIEVPAGRLGAGDHEVRLELDPADRTARASTGEVLVQVDRAEPEVRATIGTHEGHGVLTVEVTAHGLVPRGRVEVVDDAGRTLLSARLDGGRVVAALPGHVGPGQWLRVTYGGDAQTHAGTAEVVVPPW